ncbi:aquaporin-like protein [Thamnocephalis sphaerospora]|uniref:Aquaporin-like protein n=1 Tax=Thamnocephalis sphaerospora TaxID=78915 RepID=A0A4P9XVR7_9FUNG|nr:aquaporin-like protein [Thamnocephalis sphaerospora]|eukprot:RKP10376.1 aquaporin-like protein [Thamnocephalis sphaerospora]
MSTALEGLGAPAVLGSESAVAAIPNTLDFASSLPTPSNVPRPHGPWLRLGKPKEIALWLQCVFAEYLGEFMGTWMFVSIGVCVNAQYVLVTKDDSGRFFAMNWIWGFSLMMGAYTSAGVSGSHLNPAMTLACLLYRRFSLWKAIGFWTAQIGGAYVGAAFSYIYWLPAIHQYDGHIKRATGPTGIGRIFYSESTDYESNAMRLWIETYGTAIFVFVLFALNDRKNNPLAGPIIPIIRGLTMAAITTSYGSPAGYAINPIRDFGPRLFLLSAGYGTVTFTEHSAYFWIPLCGPLFGGVLGGFMYQILIRPLLMDMVVERGGVSATH